MCEGADGCLIGNETHLVFKPCTDAKAIMRKENRAGAVPSSLLYKHQGVLPDSEHELCKPGNDLPGLH